MPTRFVSSQRGLQEPDVQIYDASLDQLLRSQHRDPLLRHLTRTLVALSKRHAPDADKTPTIDIGCGVGRTSMAMAEQGYPVIGVDPSARAVEVATGSSKGRDKLRGRVSFYEGDALKPPPADWQGAFKLALCSEVIEHVEAPERVIDYASAVLAPGGILILTTPHDARLWTTMDDYAGHVQRFSTAQLEGLLQDFEILDLATEGFPFQRTVMRTYDRMLARSGGEHNFDGFGGSPAYRAYTIFMPLLLRVDHLLRGLRRGTTLVAVARRR